MNFVYISPHFPDIHEKFCRSLHDLGARVLGVGDASYESLSLELRAALTEYYKVDSLEDYDQVFRALAFFSFKYGKIDWLESNNEHWLALDARLRSDFNITSGIRLDEIERIKSKAVMKQVYLANGIPTARQQRLENLAEAEAFVREVGFPLIAKPDVGVGATNSYKVNDEAEWREFLGYELTAPYVLEEFIDGDIVSYDALVGEDGVYCFELLVEWPPSILDIVVERLDLCYRVSRELPKALRELGRRTVSAFQVRNRFVHLEYFRLRRAKAGLGKRGDFVALEVNMRPAGGNTPDMYNYAAEMDIYRLYAELVCFGGLREAVKPAPNFCSYASRRDELAYSPPHEEILARYGDGIVQQGRNPEMSVPQMGHQFYLFKSSDKARVKAFETDVERRVKG